MDGDFQSGGPFLDSGIGAHLCLPATDTMTMIMRRELLMIRVFHFFAFSVAGGSEGGGIDGSPWSFDRPGAMRWELLTAWRIQVSYSYSSLC